MDGEWNKPNVKDCESYQFAAVRSTVSSMCVGGVWECEDVRVLGYR